ncbi:MAG: hypothetical protein EU536_04795 [Promethearchaeota archaeon]|nr:MAG: hypothetical protein EU536_04795 [Candidatus Lokiarchaeota archaeon]
MAVGEAEIVFLISSGIMLALFLLVYSKLYRKPEVQRSHKIVYALLFPGLTILGGISIFLYQIFITWDEVLMFHVVWIPIFLLMFQEVAGRSHAQKIPFVKLLLAVALTILLIFCLTFILLDVLTFISLGVWSGFFPLPIFIVVVIVTGPLFILAARLYGKGEEEFTGGSITSGGITFLYIIGFTYGLFFIAAGSGAIVLGEVSWIPVQIGVILLIIGILITALSIIKLEKERRKRKDAGYDW